MKTHFNSLLKSCVRKNPTTTHCSHANLLWCKSNVRHSMWDACRHTCDKTHTCAGLINMQEIWADVQECATEGESMQQIQNMCIGGDTSRYTDPTNEPKKSWVSLPRTASQPSLTSAGAEVFEGVRDSVERMSLGQGGGGGGVPQLVQVDSSVGVCQLLITPNQRRLLFLVLLFHLHP